MSLPRELTSKKPARLSDGRVVLDELRELLSDGEFHSKMDLYTSTSCPTWSSFKYQLLVYRRQLPDDEILICELVRRTIGYRQVKHLVTPKK